MKYSQNQLFHFWRNITSWSMKPSLQNQNRSLSMQKLSTPSKFQYITCTSSWTPEKDNQFYKCYLLMLCLGSHGIVKFSPKLSQTPGFIWSSTYNYTSIHFVGFVFEYYYSCRRFKFSKNALNPTHVLSSRKYS